MTQESRQTEILRPACKELIRIERVEPHPRADPPRLRGRDLGPAGAGGGRRAGGHLPRRRCRSRRRSSPSIRRYEAAPALRCRPAADDLDGARRGAAGRGQAPARCCAGGGVHISRRRRRCSRLSPAPMRIPGRAHHDRQGRDRLHRSAQRRPVRPLRPHRQRADRGSRRACSSSAASSARSRPSASPSRPKGKTRHPSRHRRRGVRPHLPSRLSRSGATRATASAICTRRCGRRQAARGRARRIRQRASRKRMGDMARRASPERSPRSEMPVNDGAHACTSSTA